MERSPRFAMPLEMRTLIPFALLALQALANSIPPFFEWEHQRVALSDVSIHFQYAGSGPPLFLIHGSPQHSYTWETVGPILAQNYTVIALDNRGMGDSSVPLSFNFSAPAAAGDIAAVANFLGINQTFIVGHDKGAGIVSALAATHPSLVRRLVVADYVLPGLGYETFSDLSYDWNLYSNWHLTFFSVTDSAEFFIRGRVREMLEWYFFHISYSGGASFTNAKVTRYVDALSKPGFLRAMLSYFQAGLIGFEARFFNSTIVANKIAVPVLALAGEASFGGPPGLQQQIWEPVASNLSTDVVPKAGHWLADENPTWFANRIAQFFNEDRDSIPAVDLSYLKNKVTLHGFPTI